MSGYKRKEEKNIYNKEIDGQLISELISVVSSGDLNRIRNFVSQNHSNLNITNKQINGSLLHVLFKIDNDIISEDKKYQIADYLIQNGVSVNAFDTNNVTPLHIVSGKHYETVVNLLLKNGANVNAKDSQDMTPLHYASMGYIKVCEPDIKVKPIIPEVKQIEKNINPIIRDVQSLMIQLLKTPEYSPIFNHIYNTLMHSIDYDTVGLSQPDITSFKTHISEIINSPSDIQSKKDQIQSQFVNSQNSISNKLETRLHTGFFQKLMFHPDVQDPTGVVIPEIGTIIRSPPVLTQLQKKYNENIDNYTQSIQSLSTIHDEFQENIGKVIRETQHLYDCMKVIMYCCFISGNNKLYGKLFNIFYNRSLYDPYAQAPQSQQSDQQPPSDAEDQQPQSAAEDQQSHSDVDEQQPQSAAEDQQQSDAEDQQSDADEQQSDAEDQQSDVDEQQSDADDQLSQSDADDQQPQSDVEDQPQSDVDEQQPQSDVEDQQFAQLHTSQQPTPQISLSNTCYANATYRFISAFPNDLKQKIFSEKTTDSPEIKNLRNALKTVVDKFTDQTRTDVCEAFVKFKSDIKFQGRQEDAFEYIYALLQILAPNTTVYKNKLDDQIPIETLSGTDYEIIKVHHHDNNQIDTNLITPSGMTLKSVIIYRGTGEQGHYYTYELNFDNTGWTKYDDNRISKLQYTNIINDIQTNGVIFLFVKPPNWADEEDIYGGVRNTNVRRPARQRAPVRRSAPTQSRPNVRRTSARRARPTQPRAPVRRSAPTQQPANVTSGKYLINTRYNYHLVFYTTVPPPPPPQQYYYVTKIKINKFNEEPIDEIIPENCGEGYTYEILINNFLRNHAQTDFDLTKIIKKFEQGKNNINMKNYNINTVNHDKINCLAILFSLFKDILKQNDIFEQNIAKLYDLQDNEHKYDAIKRLIDYIIYFGIRSLIVAYNEFDIIQKIINEIQRQKSIFETSYDMIISCLFKNIQTKIINKIQELLKSIEKNIHDFIDANNKIIDLLNEKYGISFTYYNTMVQNKLQIDTNMNNSVYIPRIYNGKFPPIQQFNYSISDSYIQFIQQLMNIIQGNIQPIDFYNQLIPKIIPNVTFYQGGTYYLSTPLNGAAYDADIQSIIPNQQNIQLPQNYAATDNSIGYNQELFKFDKSKHALNNIYPIIHDYLALIKQRLIEKIFLDNNEPIKKQIIDTISDYIKELYGKNIQNKHLSALTYVFMGKIIDELLIEFGRTTISKLSSQIVSNILQKENPELKKLFKNNFPVIVTSMKSSLKLGEINNEIMKQIDTTQDIALFSLDQIITQIPEKKDKHIIRRINYGDSSYPYEKLCYYNKPSVIKSLSNNSSTNFQLTDIKGDTPISKAIFISYVDIIKELLPHYSSRMIISDPNIFGQALSMYQFHNSFICKDGTITKIIDKLTKSYYDEFKKGIYNNEIYGNNILKYSHVVLPMFVILYNQLIFRYGLKHLNNWTAANVGNIANILIDNQIITDENKIYQREKPLYDTFMENSAIILQESPDINVLQYMIVESKKKIQKFEENKSKIDAIIAENEKYIKSLDNENEIDAQYIKGLTDKNDGYRERLDKIEELLDETQKQSDNYQNNINIKIKTLIDGGSHLNEFMNFFIFSKVSVYYHQFYRFIHENVEDTYNGSYDKLWDLYINDDTNLRHPQNIHLLLVSVQRELLNSLEVIYNDMHSKQKLSNENRNRLQVIRNNFFDIQKFYDNVATKWINSMENDDYYFDKSKNIPMFDTIDIINHVITTMLGGSFLGIISKYLTQYLINNINQDQFKDITNPNFSYLDGINTIVKQILTYEITPNSSITYYINNLVNENGFSMKFIKYIFNIKKDNDEILTQPTELFKPITQILSSNTIQKISPDLIAQLEKNIYPFINQTYSSLISAIQHIITNYNSYILNDQNNIEIMILLINQIMK